MNLKEELKKLKELARKKLFNIDEDELDYMIDEPGEEILDDDKLCEYLKMSNFNESTEPSPHAKALSDHFKCKTVVLDDEVLEFLKWCEDVMEENPQNLKNFIEKMAVWYELRYPDYEVNRKFPGIGQAPVNVNDEMFNKNPYINMFFDENNDIRYLDWDDFYNTRVFINSLSCEEKRFLQKPRFNDIVNFRDWRVHLHLTKKGVVTAFDESRLLERKYTKKFDMKQILGKNIRDVIEYLKNEGIPAEEYEELENNIKYYDNWVYQKDEMLNSVMYRIIERGGNRIGPRRAFLFAKEFGRNIDIPMMYGVDLADPGLKMFINEYLKSGGKKDLNCYIGYGLREIKYQNLDTITIEELFKLGSQKYDYTAQEKNLHQSLVNVLASQINQDELIKQQEIANKEQVKQLRLERKIKKSKVKLVKE